MDGDDPCGSLPHWCKPENSRAIGLKFQFWERLKLQLGQFLCFGLGVV